MGVNKMQGTPWHIEVLKKSNDDRIRNKKWCVHNKNGTCVLFDSKCMSSKNCDNYQYNEEYVKTKNKRIDKYSSFNINDKNNLKGRFTLEFEDGSCEQFIINESIKVDAPIFDYVLNTKIDDYFNFNGENIKVVMKKIKMKEGANILKDALLNKIIDCKEIDKSINDTKYVNFKFKIKNLKNNEVYHFICGKNISWNEGLVHKVTEVKCGSIFNYRGEDLLLVSKYVIDKKSIR